MIPTVKTSSSSSSDRDDAKTVPSTPTATSSGTSTSSSVSRDGSAKTLAADQISQAIQSTSNLLHLMLQSSPAQAELMKLPGSLFAKTAMIRNTESLLQQMPQVISSLDAHMDTGLQSVPRLETVIQLLSNIENSQLKLISGVQPDHKETENKPKDKPLESG